ncbi:FAD-dependent oxidoreductase [Nitriliruptor alkaliphilus]|uniref:FAD-dependent oxidoreductase n=1 Tax=Nitriliruptor alkaliphilus TaxID=427918 RepID=UPI000697533A|nr:FAD-dependent oxidoreductase [Nitriliruptor alkaliphilus]
MTELTCDLLVVGGGMGGVAAALAGVRSGLDVVMSEEHRWLGGQLTTQAVPPDEHPWIEWTGANRSYRQLRELIRARYRRRPLVGAAATDPELNPGSCWVSRLGCEPAEAAAAIETQLEPFVAAGVLRILRRHVARSVAVDADSIRAVELAHLGGGEATVVSARYVLDATEEGDLLPLAGCEYAIGGEGRAVTGEPDNTDEPDPSCQQAITWCFALEHRPGEDHTIARPAEYGFWRNHRASFWPGPQLGWETQEPETGRPLRRPLFGGGQDLWTFRRIRYGGHYPPGWTTDVTVVNWPQVDYWRAPVVDVTPEERRAALDGAEELSRSFLHWLQVDAPRPDGGTGWPGLRPVPDVLGTGDGFAQRHYTREGRRIQALTVVRQQDVGVVPAGPTERATEVADSVGVGSYRIDLHPSTCGRGYVDVPSWPFQIPLGMLIPVRLRNLLAAGKSAGTTHVTNGCFRLHPVEWSLGEAAGAIAAFSVRRDVEPAQVHAGGSLLQEFLGRLDQLGVQRRWPEEVARQAR